MLKKLAKLRGRNFNELKERTRQQASIFAERIGGGDLRMLDNDGFFGKIDLPGRDVTTESLLEHFRSRTTPHFYRSMIEPKESAAALRKRFPAEERALIAQAEKISRGRFDLLGFENLYFNNEIPDWHLDPVSGRSSPKVHWSQIDELNFEQTGDKKVIWELNRHQYFSALGRAYFLSTDEKYAELWSRHLEDWLRNNPPKVGVNWLSSLEIALRSISWIWALNFFKNSPHLTGEILSAMLTNLYLNARHIENYLSTYFSPNTHLTGEALGLYFIGTFLPEFREAKRWRDLGYKILMDALEFQVRPDGTYVEQCTHYHRYTTDFYANLMILRQLNGEEVTAVHLQKLNKLFDFLLHATQPNGETALIGDDDGGRFYFFDDQPINDLRPTLALGATLLGRGDLKFAAGAAGPDLFWLLGSDGLERFDALDATEPAERQRAFSDGGFFAARDSWKTNSDHVLISCGPHGFLNGGHAHADALSFVLSLGGCPVFVDAGTYCYTSDPESRQLFRSSAAHNCLTVNSRSSSVPAGPFSWHSTATGTLLKWDVREDSAIFRGTHDGFKDLGVAYEREIVLNSGGSSTITDELKSNGRNNFQTHFILAPGLTAEAGSEDNSVIVRDASDEFAVAISTDIFSETGIPAGRWSIEPWELSLRYGSKEKSTKLVFTLKAQGIIKIVHRIRMSPHVLSSM